MTTYNTKKNKTNKIVILLFSFFILHSSFIISCRDPFDPDKFTPANNPAQGMGTFTLSIAGEDAPQDSLQSRAIMPRQETSFTKYKLAFFDCDSGFNKEFDNYEIGDAIALPASTYDLIVYAYVLSDDDDPAARGFLDEIEIPVSGNVAGEVTLFPIPSAEGGDGIFLWNLSFPDDMQYVYMEITEQDEHYTVIAAYNIIGSQISNNVPNTVTQIYGNTNASLELPVGDYRVVFTLKKTGTATSETVTREVTWRETLHIYQNLTSEYDYTFTNAHFADAFYTVTFDFYHDEMDAKLIAAGKTPPDQNSEIWVITETFWYDGLVVPSIPAGLASQMGLLGFDVDALSWHTSKEFGETVMFQYQFENNLIGNITLYANWRQTGGTPENPFLVRDEYDLQAVGGTGIGTGYNKWIPTAHYKQVFPITAGAFTPLPEFNGVYDGQGNMISNLVINGITDTDNQGLFSIIGTGGVVRNVVLSEVKITSTGTNTGGIAGTNNGTIENSAVTHVNSFIKGTAYTGGIAGNNNGTIQRCFITAGQIEGTEHVGGIAGNNASSKTIADCYTISNVTASVNYAGGIIGYNSGSVVRGYSISVVTAADWVGGIAGYNNGTIDRAVALNPNLYVIYNTLGTINHGRIVGQSTGGLTNNYARPDMRIRNIGNGTGLNTAAFTASATATGVHGAAQTVTGASGTPMDDVFPNDPWATGTWNKPGTPVKIGNPLPTLIARSDSAPILPAVDNLFINLGTSGEVRIMRPTKIPVDVQSMISFNKSGGQQGWYTKKIYGTWTTGQIVPAPSPGPMPVSVPNIQGQNYITGLDYSYLLGDGGRIGTITFKRKTGNTVDYHPVYFDVTIKINEGIEYEKITLSIAISANSRGYGSNTVVIEMTEGTEMYAEFRCFYTSTMAVTVDIISSENWIYDAAGITDSYAVFKEAKDEIPVFVRLATNTTADSLNQRSYLLATSDSATATANVVSNCRVFEFPAGQRPALRDVISLVINGVLYTDLRVVGVGAGTGNSNCVVLRQGNGTITTAQAGGTIGSNLLFGNNSNAGQGIISLTDGTRTILDINEKYYYYWQEDGVSRSTKSGKMDFLEFTDGAPYIVVRTAPEEADSDGWIADPNGPDNNGSLNYSSPIWGKTVTKPLILAIDYDSAYGANDAVRQVENIIVGTADIKLVGGSGYTSTGVLTSANIEVYFNLSPAYDPFISQYWCAIGTVVNNNIAEIDKTIPENLVTGNPHALSGSTGLVTDGGPYQATVVNNGVEGNNKYTYTLKGFHVQFEFN